MTKDLATDLFLPLNLTQLVGNKGFYNIPEGQIITYYMPWGIYVITNISSSNDYTAAHFELLPKGAPFRLENTKLVYTSTPVDIPAIVDNLSLEIKYFLKKNKLGVLPDLPLSVVFPDGTCLQPDLVFVANHQSTIVQQQIQGTPDFIVDVLPKGSIQERETKFNCYQAQGVAEYWRIDPQTASIEVFQLQNNTLVLVQTAQAPNSIASTVLSGFTVNVADIFE